MRKIMILLAAFLSMACVDARRGDGSILADMNRAELTGPERALIEERFGGDFAEAARLGVAGDALFGFARCELNGAAPEELVAVGRSPAHCVGVDREDQPICGLWVLARTPDGWIEVLETAGQARLAESTTNGWRDFVLDRGGPPTTMKFGGVAYQSDIGDAAPVPRGLEDWSDERAGRGGLDWYGFDDPMPPLADAAFLWFYRNEIRGGGERVGALPDAFRIGVADLDAEPPEDVVVQGVSPEFCAPEGCRFWVLTKLGGDGPPRIAARITGFDLQVALTGGAGGRDLAVSGGGGLSIWRNDGDGWVRSEPR